MATTTQQPPSLLHIMQRLIATPSVSSVNTQWDQTNIDVITQLEEWLSVLGFTTQIHGIDQCPGKFNLIATAGSGSEGLVLSGHTDTVPFDEGRWSQSPFRLTEKNNRLYGLGSCDMKGFFALVIEAVRDLDLKQLTQPLIIIATADEESSMCGARSLKNQFPLPGRHTLIGEPTDLKPIRLHKGIMMEAIRLTGQSGHSSNPSLGHNALEGMHDVIDDLMQWRQELQQRYHNPLFDIDVPTLNLGHIHGGDNPNRICADCELHIDIRPLPGMAIDDLRNELSHRLQHKLADSALTLEFLPLFDGIPAMETPADAAIVKAVEEMTGHQAQAVAFGTEGPFFNDMGMETVILGPGSIDQAHQPNEFLAMNQIKPGVKLIKQLIRKFCYPAS